MLLKLISERKEVKTNSFSVVDQGNNSLAVVFAGVNGQGFSDVPSLVMADLDMSMQQFDALYEEAQQKNAAVLDLTPYAAQRLTR